MNKYIKDYIELVRSDKYKVCEEQLLLCDFIERVFKEEDIYVDEKQLEEYLDYQKYFPFNLYKWEKFCFTLHNCTYKKEDGRPRFPDLFIYVGRGAGKNGYLSFEDFCLLTPTNRINKYHIDICANSKEQAETTFKDIYDILEEHSSVMDDHFKWNKEKIENKDTKSILKFRTSNAKTKDGGRPGKVDFDERHQYENYDTIEVFVTGFGKVPHSRQTILTTDGNIRGGPLDDDKAKAQAVLRGEIPDNGFLPFICKLDKEEEVHDENCWYKANPSLAYNEDLLYEMKKEYQDFTLNHLGNRSFMTKRMNLPKGDTESEVTSWENILATNKPIPDLAGKPCVAGLDYASTTDFVGLGLLFIIDDIHYFIQHSFVCKRSKDLSRIKFPLQDAEERGLLTFVDEVEVHPDIIAEWLYEKSKEYNILGLGLDKFRYTLVTKALRKIGFDADKKGRNNIQFVRPNDEMQIGPLITSLFANQKVVYGDDQLMRWYTNNTKLEMSKTGNITYGKIEPKSRKTDGFKAFIAAEITAENLKLEEYNNRPKQSSMKVWTSN